MPRVLRPGSETTVFNMLLLRHYLWTAHVQDGFSILDDCFHFREPGATQMVVFCLSLRGNVRTRRSLQTVRAEWMQQGRPNPPQAARWYSTLAKQLMGVYRQWRQMAYPTATVVSEASLQQRLTRSVRRMLGYSGVVKVAVPTLEAHALATVNDLRQRLQGQPVVMWVDNWYWERYSTSPSNPVLSQNVTAMGVLLLRSTLEGPAQATRSHQLPPFSPVLTLHHMTIRVNNTTSGVVTAAAKLGDVVQRMVTAPLQGAWIRVPLDLHRPQVTSLQWRALALSQMRVSNADELLQVLRDVLAVQQQVGSDLLLLVDEKIHYSICRLLYSRSYVEYNVGAWLRNVHLLYGVWHPYKQTLSLVYRTFFPIFGVLECTGQPTLGTQVTWQRKVLFMEKMCAALLLAAPAVRQELQRVLLQPPVSAQTQVAV